MTENVHVCFQVHIKKLKTLTINKNGSFSLNIYFARQVNTIVQKVFIRNVSLRLFSKSNFCVCFEVHIPVMLIQNTKDMPEPNQ